jgi:hypothetical protein
MELVLVDWTQMGDFYCLAGAISQRGSICFVRPLPIRTRKSSSTFNGWPAPRIDGHMRWEVFDMIDPSPEQALPPHLEDAWVRDLRPCRKSVTAEWRRAILEAGVAQPDTPIFGVELKQLPSGSCYLDPNTGNRSLATVMLPSAELQFTAHQCDGADASNNRYHVRLNLPGHSAAILAVKDYLLLRQAREYSTNLDSQVSFLNEAVRQMGARICVRLGLARPVSLATGQPGRCWLMADGFFSPDDPQS